MCAGTDGGLFAALCPKVHLEPAETDLSDTESSQQSRWSEEPCRPVDLFVSSCLSLRVCPGDHADGAALRRTPGSICFFKSVSV